MFLNKHNQSVNTQYVGSRLPMLKQRIMRQPIYSYASNYNEKERAFDLPKVLSALFHRKWTVIFTTAAFSLLALIISFSIKPAFKATAMLEISRNSDKVFEFERNTSRVPISEDKEFYSTQYGLLTSPALGSRVIKELRLDAAQLDFTDPKKSKEILKSKSIEEVFLSYLSIDPVLKSRLVKISYENSDPRLASTIVNTLVKNFIQSNMEKYIDKYSYKPPEKKNTSY